MKGVYLLHLDPPYKHARHYLGWALDIRARVHEHVNQPSAASPLLQAQLATGGRVWVTRVWPNLTRRDERRLKNAANVPGLCPLCRPAHLAKRRAEWPERRKKDPRYRQ